MKINVDRLCELAGLNSGRSKGRVLSEASNSTFRDEQFYRDEAEYRYGKNQLAEDGERLNELLPDMETEVANQDDEDPDASEEIEVDEVMLVQELRRAKKMMMESKRRKRRRSSKSLQEQQLQRIIDDEVKNVIRDMNLSTSWIYGNKKPRRSRKGYVNQGSFLKGPGFK